MAREKVGKMEFYFIHYSIWLFICLPLLSMKLLYKAIPKNENNQHKQC